ncbi:MAG: rubrerythrin family protein [Chloroflexi bacterium]|nr:rubrerythrin family protein [Chloroflexota bacterium]
MRLSDSDRELVLAFQRNEITEHHIYTRLARTLKSGENRQLIEQIAADELRHYQFWREYTGQDMKPDRLKIGWFGLINRILGFTFGIKLMERGEEQAHGSYTEFTEVIHEAERIAQEEDEHEEALIALLDEQRLRYTGSIVLGLNDALVELTGALAGLTFALQNTQLIAMTGAITGIAAALSMGTSEYLSTKAEDTSREPVRAAIYTGIAYVATVVILILPYLLLKNYYACLACTMAAAILIIGLFNYYIAVAKDVPFKQRFVEMSGLSLGVAALSFGIGVLMRTVFGIDV